MQEKPIVVYTNHYTNRTLCYNFAVGSNALMCHIDNFNDFSKTIATYGYLRGTGDLIKRSKNFYYMDHGYFKQSKRKFENNKTKIVDFDGYFRIVQNNYWHNGKGNKPSDRLNKLNLNFKNLTKNGNYIILSEPTEDAKNFYNLHDWVANTKKKLKDLTDRKLIVHNRSSPTPLINLLENAWAFVSDHSSAGFIAMQEGVPAYFTNSTLSNIGKIEDIEKNNIKYSVFNNLAYEQWTIEEIHNGECWEYLINEKNKK